MSYPELAERLRKAFKKRSKWFRTICPNCDRPVEYQPKENWNGRLKCGNCQHEFTLSLLTHFSIRYEDEEKEE